MARRTNPDRGDYSALDHLECSSTAQIFGAEQPQGLSAQGTPLVARYDLEKVSRFASPKSIAVRPPNLWRYHELLPVRSPRHVITMGEGMTPLFPLNSYGTSIGLHRLLLKDDGGLPTGSFKCRAAAVGVSRAAELGVKGVALPTNGNAGAAWAAYAARAGIPALVGMPADAPPISRAECVVVGAEVFLVNGHIGDAGRLVSEAASARDHVQDVSTLKEPYRLEGKKTMGLEIAEQLGWRMPDVIVYPTGGGVGLLGIYKALRELQELGWIGDKVPRLVAVQAEGCAPIVEAFAAGEHYSKPPKDPRTIAFGITVPKPIGDFMILDALRSTGGTAVAVSDAAIIAELHRVAALEGTFVCPETAACFAALRELRDSRWVASTEEVVVLNTGTGLKYPQTVDVDLPLLTP